MVEWTMVHVHVDRELMTMVGSAIIIVDYNYLIYIVLVYLYPAILGNKEILIFISNE